MPTIKINNLEIKAPLTQTLWEAARDAGIHIPVMCYHPEAGHFASCMVCMVKDAKTGALIPSCDTHVREGLEVITEDAEILEARTTALELLLSEHTGDCEAPCRIACPAYMDIPHMNRHIANGNPFKAMGVVMEHIPLPSVLGLICPAPCEGACHRKGVDEAVAICHLKRFAGNQGDFTPPKPASPTGKRVAIVGAGPAGLSAGYYLQLMGIECHIFDSNPEAGGALRYSIADAQLPRDVLNREVQRILSTGIKFIGSTNINAQSFLGLAKSFDAVVIACGNFTPSMASWGIDNDGKQIKINKNTYLTSNPKVFAAGNSTRSMKLAVRSVGQGHSCATSVEQFLKGAEVTGEHRSFNSRIGKLLPEEHGQYLQGVSGAKRVKMESEAEGYSHEQAKQEAQRCMHCECLKPRSCTLRRLADEYGASRTRFSLESRKPLKKNLQHQHVAFEPGKCIKCGICVRLTAKHQEVLGLTFIGRGFDVEIGVPLGAELSQGLAIVAELAVEACPTGALSKKM